MTPTPKERIAAVQKELGSIQRRVGELQAELLGAFDAVMQQIRLEAEALNTESTEAIPSATREIVVACGDLRTCLELQNTLRLMAADGQPPKNSRCMRGGVTAFAVSHRADRSRARGSAIGTSG